jgi:uncharacterized membrane protein YdjX (TVP38/TMEM64 family)
MKGIFNKYKKNLLLIFIILIIIGFYSTGLHENIGLENIQRNLSWLKMYKASHSLFFVSIFCGIYILLTSLSIPGTIVLTLLSGSLFGVIMGTLLVLSSSTIGGSIAFLLSRYILRNTVSAHFSKQYLKINKRFQQRGITYLFTLRLIPISPFVLINLIMGLTRISWWTFMWVTFLGMLPGTFIYVLAGREISRIENVSDILTPPILISLTLIGFFPIILRKMMAYQ